MAPTTPCVPIGLGPPESVPQPPSLAPRPNPILLNSLPTEIITQIFEYFVPDEPEIGETKPVAYDKLSPGESWYEFTRNRTSLRNLCLVSRKFSAIARPLLYRVVAATDELSLSLLFRTAIERQEYCLWLRFFSCHLTLTDYTTWRETWRCIKRLLKDVDRRLLALADIASQAINYLLDLPSFPYKPPSATFAHAAELAVCVILFRARRLRTLLLQLPVVQADQDYLFMMEILRPSVDLRPVSTRAPWMMQGYPPCPELTTLLLQADPEDAAHLESDTLVSDDHEEELTGASHGRYWRLLTAFPKLQTLECTLDNGRWDWRLHPPAAASGSSLFPSVPAVSTTPASSGLAGGGPPADLPASMPNLRHLYLHQSMANPRDLIDVIRRFPCLETLYLTPYKDTDVYGRLTEDEESGISPGVGPGMLTLDEALVRYGQNLAELDIAWFEYFEPGVSTDDEGMPSSSSSSPSSIGPESRLTSLARLSKLEKLCVQFQLLFAEDKVLDEGLAEMLPASLVELTLEDWWWSDAELDIELWVAEDAEHNFKCDASVGYRQDVKKMLNAFALSCRPRLPRLKKVTFQSRIPSSFSRAGVITLDEQFSDITRQFRDVGVAFVTCEI